MIKAAGPDRYPQGLGCWRVCFGDVHPGPSRAGPVARTTPINGSRVEACSASFVVTLYRLHKRIGPSSKR
jgi:hypothetical protein